MIRGMARPQVYDDALRTGLIGVATEQLADGGADSLSLRRVAGAAGTSTNAIYTLFGGKNELIEAAVVDALSSFAAAQESAPLSDDPLVDLRSLSDAYRRWAIRRPALYAVIFGGRLGQPVETGRTIQAGERALAPLVARVARAVDAGMLRPEDPELIARAIWAAVHGAVSLESQGLADESLYRAVEAALLRGWAPDPPQ